MKRIFNFINRADSLVNDTFNNFEDGFNPFFRALDKKRRGKIHAVEGSIKDLARSVLAEGGAKDAFLSKVGGHKIIRWYQQVVAPFCVRNVKDVKVIPSQLRYNVEEFNKPEWRGCHAVDYDDSVTKYVGVYPGNIWFRPAAIVPRKIDVPKDIDITDEQREKLNLTAVFGGSWPTNCHHAARYFSKSVEKLTYEDYREAIEEALHVMPAFQCDMPVMNEMVFNNIKPEAFAGQVASFFSSNKGDAAQWCHIVAEWIWGRVASSPVGNFKDMSVFSGGGRARRHPVRMSPDDILQIIREYDPAKVIDSRLVQAPEYPQQIVQAAWQSKFANYFHNVNMTKGTWLYLGQSFVHNGFKRLYELIGKVCLEGDWSDFDVRVHYQDAIIAFAIIFSYFPDTTKSWRFMLWCCQTFIVRVFVIPGGEMYLTKKGVPSGVCWTSDIDTIVNIVKWCYLILNDPTLKARGIRPRDLKAAFGGDDFVIRFPDDLSQVPSRRLYARAKELWDWEIKDIRVGSFVDIQNDDDSLTFFKVGLNKFLLPIIRTPEMVKRVNTPERKPRGTWDKWYSQACNVPCVGKARDAFYSMVSGVAAKCADFDVSSLLPGSTPFKFNTLEMELFKAKADECYEQIICRDIDPVGQYSLSASSGKILLDYLGRRGRSDVIAPAADIAHAYLQLYYYKLNNPTELGKIPFKLIEFKYLLKDLKVKAKKRDRRKLKRQQANQASLNKWQLRPLFNTIPYYL